MANHKTVASRVRELSLSAKIAFISLLCISLSLPFITTLQLHDTRQHAATLTTYYVSPTGNDANPGTQTQPWQTLHQAAAAAGPGSTVIFTDGTYNENAKVYFRALGTSTAPIVFKAQNKWGAKIVFGSGANDTERIYVTGNYYTFDGFDITSTVYTSGDSADNGVRFWPGANNDTLINCKISNVMIAAKSNGDYTLFANNIVGTPTAPSPGALEFFGNFGGVMRDNIVYYASNYAGALNAKGGARSVQMYNNEIHILGPSYLGIDLGGFSDGTSPPYDRAGWENYNSVAFNNIVIVDSGGQLYGGIGTTGGNTEGIYNNIVIGADRGLYTDFGGEDKGPGNWYNTTPGNRNGDPPVVNAIFENNIVMNSTKYATEYLGLETGTTPLTDYNNFYNNPSATPTQTHPITGNPLFVNNTSDWHLQSTSPDLNKGATISNFTGYNGEAINVSFDKNYWTRTTPWDVGIYEHDGIPQTGTTPTPTVTNSPSSTPVATPTLSDTPTPVPTSAPLPTPWQQSMIGATQGSASVSNSVFTLSNAGTDIWGTADSFEYVYQTLSGDGTITAKIATLGSSDPWAKAGVMIRQDTSVGALNAFIGLTSANGATFQARLVTNDVTSYGIASPPQPQQVPYWVRLNRSGTTLTGSISSDGVTWTQLGSATISFVNPILVGLATTSHNTSIINTATFSNVTVTTGSSTPTPTLPPTSTPTPKPTSTPTPLPTNTPAPTSTPVPNSAKAAITVFLHGIGKGGDNTNPTSIGNTNPLHPQRTVQVYLYNASNTLIGTPTGTVTYNSTLGNFSGVIDLGSSIPSGSYLVKIKSDNYLRAAVGGIITFTTGQTTTVPTVSLIVGDSNNDNLLNILDYNLLLDCYSDIGPARACDPTKFSETDLNDDGAVNQYDYNLFLRELSVQAGV